MGILQMAVAAIVALALALTAGVWAWQRHMVYRFGTSADTPDSVGLTAAQVVEFAAADGQTISAWVVPPQEDAPVILSFFGNFTTVGPSAVRMQPLLDRGYGMAMLVYRGSGQAPGIPSEMALSADALALYDALDTLLDAPVPPSQRIIHGFSLGSGIAVNLAGKRPVAGLIVEAGYDRLCRFQEARAKGFPLCRLMWAERHDVIDQIGDVEMPVLFAHGQLDSAIPITWGKTLYDAAPEPKAFQVYDQGNHANLMQHGLADDIDTFIKRVTDSTSLGSSPGPDER